MFRKLHKYRLFFEKTLNDNGIIGIHTYMCMYIMYIYAFIFIRISFICTFVYACKHAFCIHAHGVSSHGTLQWHFENV